MSTKAYRTFQEVRSAIEEQVADRQFDEADRIVRWLVDRAKITRAREHDAAAWFARGILEDGRRNYPAAEKALRVAVDTCRQLYPAANNSLGVAARSLGVVYGHMDRPEEAIDMFLLARNVFEKTDPELAPEVIRLSASCFVAVRKLDEALAVIQQAVGAPDALTPLKSPDELDLYLLRARVFEEQNKPAQALKTLARVTQLLTPEPAVRTTVAGAWIAIARIWFAAGKQTAAAHAFDCANLADVRDQVRGSQRVIECCLALGLERPTLRSARAPFVHHASKRGAVAIGCPGRGLFLTRSSEPFEVGAFAAVMKDADGRQSVVRPIKAIYGYLTEPSQDRWPPPAVQIISKRAGWEFEAGEVVLVDDGLAEPAKRTVLYAWKNGIVLDSAAVPSRLSAILPPGARQALASVVGPGARPSPLLPQAVDDAIRQLLVAG